MVYDKFVWLLFLSQWPQFIMRPIRLQKHCTWSKGSCLERGAGTHFRMKLSLVAATVTTKFYSITFGKKNQKTFQQSWLYVSVSLTGGAKKISPE